MKNPDYRRFLLAESSKYNLTASLKSHQMPNVELATLFLKEAVSLYLKDQGIIDFVMPKSVLVSEQHRDFRKWKEQRIEPIEVLDLEGVIPLFNVPACVIKAKKLP